MLQASALIALFQRAHDEKWGYIYGASGQTWTKAKQAAATRAQTVKYGARWIGQRVADCSGLFAWAFKELGGSIYHGSNTIWNRHLSQKGTLRNGARTDGQPLKPGTSLFLTKTENGVTNRHHIGLYIGNDTVIEAKGTAYGVVTSRSDHWDEWGELKAVLYEGSETKMDDQTVRRGDKGEAVLNLQTLLLKAGYTLPCHGADGDFGAETERTVRQYQAENGLTVNGICGAAMWEHLKQTAQTLETAQNEGDIEADFDALLDSLKALLIKYGKYDKA